MFPTLSRPLLSLFVLLGLAGCTPSAEPPARGPSEVGVLTLRTQAQTVTSELPGRTKAWLTAEIRPQVGGIVQQRLFTEGAEVKAGEVLYVINPATYQAAFEQARASTAEAKAALNSARLKATRYSELVKIDAISRQDNEDAQASLQGAQAVYQAAQAVEKSARIDLTYTRIQSPIAGRVETSSVTPGALVTASQDTPLTTVQQLDPLYIDITQSSAEVLRLKRELAEGRLNQISEDEAQIRLRLEDGTEYAHAGRLQFSSASVSQSTGSVTLRAVVPNPDGLLLPGMYVRALLQEAVDEQALLVPQRAVSRSHSGATSVLLAVDGKVEQRQISIGRSVGNQWWVTAGLATGDQVIVEGGQKVRVGDSVRTAAVVSPVTSAPLASH
ncbi:MAG: efflux RND transporter periplasmic adaptor subunit [Pseudomonas sp.]|uniref:efflux RND transporter periplasmic adaptor subunit n=1 Tax=Pseudomonas sp. TaxID=306 RepID=UPI00271AA8C7|nr:efflux RND transporter periplasmic adaptor subunit [Pseudomonas sp.]MDO9617955.1 efflux RND transporter periplasmic adaptor subunit [Pseudomonas sp.]MDP2444985.1 efflux RND transporter periplasmic adaptor subunit [Pseudomonas sp.]MDZ4332855.1 efflux RND transporter periplasmic adaptor subunit [Pseudomonas sp.]